MRVNSWVLGGWGTLKINGSLLLFQWYLFLKQTYGENSDEWIPTAAITVEDAELMQRYQDRGRLRIENVFEQLYMDKLFTLTGLQHF